MRLPVVATTITPVPASLSFAGIRYDDSNVGNGFGSMAGIGVPLSSFAALRAWGTKYYGDSSFDAWRVKAGPEFQLPSRAKLGLFYSHYADNTHTTTDAGIAEFAIPIVEPLVARASGSYSSTSGNLRSLQGSLGAGWTPVHHLELSGDVGLAQNGAVATAPFARRRSSDLPLLGGGLTPPADNSTTKNSVEPMFQLGVRLLFP
jgi:hypothetical protein